MKLKTALEIGKDCGLETVGESILNIKIHAGNLFAYTEVWSELNELITERDNLFSKTNFTNESRTEDILGWMNWRDDRIYTSDLSL